MSMLHIHTHTVCVTQCVSHPHTHTCTHTHTHARTHTHTHARTPPALHSRPPQAAQEVPMLAPQGGLGLLPSTSGRSTPEGLWDALSSRFEGSAQVREAAMVRGGGVWLWQAAGALPASRPCATHAAAHQHPSQPLHAPARTHINTHKRARTHTHTCTRFVCPSFLFEPTLCWQRAAPSPRAGLGQLACPAGAHVLSPLPAPRPPPADALAEPHPVPEQALLSRHAQREALQGLQPTGVCACVAGGSPLQW